MLALNQQLIDDVALLSARRLMDGPGRYVPAEHRARCFEAVCDIQRLTLASYVVFYERLRQRDGPGPAVDMGPDARLLGG